MKSACKILIEQSQSALERGRNLRDLQSNIEVWKKNMNQPDIQRMLQTILR